MCMHPYFDLYLMSLKDEMSIIATYYKVNSIPLTVQCKKYTFYL